MGSAPEKVPARPGVVGQGGLNKMRCFRFTPSLLFGGKSLGLSLAAVAFGFALQPAHDVSAQVRFSSSRLSRTSSQKPEAETPAASQAEATTTKLNFYSKSWDQVLKQVAESTGAELVADKIPKGRYSRQDFRNYSRAEAVRILNDELEKQDFRILEKGKYLVVLHLPAARPEYSRLHIESPQAAPVGTATVPDAAPQRPAFAQSSQPAMPAPYQEAPRQRAFERSSVTINPTASDSSRQSASNDEPRLQRSRPGAIRQLNYQSADEASTFTAEPEPQKTVRQLFEPRSRTARNLAATLYGAFRERAEIVEEGPDGLPAMRVFSADSKTNPDKPKSIVFTVAADVDANEILVEGPADQVTRVVRLLERLDVAPAANGESTRLVTTQKSAGDIAANLRPTVNRLVAQNDGTSPPPDPATPPAPGGDNLPDLVGGIRGNVDVEAMDELGVLILKGNTSDVDSVMEIIRQIELLSARSAPDIHLRLLENVDSIALAELLTQVYDELNQARGRTQTQSPQIGIIAVGRPNAVLILSPEDDRESIEKLIDELDQPVPNQATFVVIRVKNGIASSIADIIEQTWQERFGLENRPRLSADARTNSIVAVGTKADLQEVVALIEKLDTQESGAVSEVQVVELRHAVAEELATTVNQIMQSVLNPPQLGQGQLGQAFLGFGGNSSQALREVRSAVLEYLVGEGEQVRKVRSGILADIRLTADARSNTVVIASPRESMELVLALIARLDKPASSVATIKHFSLKNADATSTRTLLDELFGNETSGNTQVGVQLAGAEKASSVVPLKFSVDARTNSIVAVGTAEALQVVEALIFRLDDSDIRQRQTTIIRLKNAPAADIATAIDSFLASQIELLANQDDLISAFELVEREVIVQAETYTNSLLISATSRYFDQIREMVLTLDQELPQVIIQAMLVEVVLEDNDEFGIELGLQDSLLFSRGLGGTSSSPGFGFNSNGLPNTNTMSQGNLAGQALSNFSLGRSSATQGFGGLVLSAGSESVSVLLRALARNREMEILSRPQIRTLDNRPAYIRMVREQSRVNGFQTAQNGNFNPLVEQAEAGIILSVTPTISPDGDILISLKAEKSQFDDMGTVLVPAGPNQAEIRSTAKDKTEAETTVVVADEQTIVLGGLITKSTSNETRKVPWLGDLPIVGHGFRFDSRSTRRTELLIFLTPRIVRGHSGNELLKQIESQRLHYCEADAEEIHGPIYGIPASAKPSAFEPSSLAPDMFEVSPRNDSSQLPLPLPAPGEEESFPMTSQKEPTSRLRNPFSTSPANRVQQVGFTQPEPQPLPASKSAPKKQNPFLNFGRSLNRKE
jgi:general secretion pathway protein D